MLSENHRRGGLILSGPSKNESHQCVYLRCFDECAIRLAAPGTTFRLFVIQMLVSNHAFYLHTRSIEGRAEILHDLDPRVRGIRSEHQTME